MILTIPILICAAFVSQSIDLAREEELFGSVLADSGRFGSEVEFDGTTLAVGAPSESNPWGPDRGKVHLFELVANQWTQVQELFPPMPDDGNFGTSIDLDNGRLAVGDTWADTNGDRSGKVHIYQRIAGTWVFEQTLVAPDGMPFDSFGGSVELDGPRIAIGAPEDRNSMGYLAGSLYIFENPGTGWEFTEKLIPEELDLRQMGWDVELRGNTLLAIARQKVVEFKLGPDGWTFNAVLDPNATSTGFRFDSIDLDGDRLVIGLSGAQDSQGIPIGSAYVYERTAGNWNLVQELNASDAGFGGNFGTSVDLVGGDLLIGAYGFVFHTSAAYWFRRDTSGDFVEAARLLPPVDDDQDDYATSVAFTGDIAFVGSPGRLSDDGSVYRFLLQDGIGTSICDSTANSTGLVTSLNATGSTAVADNAVTLTVTDLPTNEFGFFISGPNVANIPVFSGILCLGPPTGRHLDAVLNSGAGGLVCHTLDLFDIAIPTPPGSTILMPGDIWIFQFWHRDVVGGPTANFSNAVEIAFD